MHVEIHFVCLWSRCSLLYYSLDAFPMRTRTFVAISSSKIFLCSVDFCDADLQASFHELSEREGSVCQDAGSLQVEMHRGTKFLQLRDFKSHAGRLSPTALTTCSEERRKRSVTRVVRSRARARYSISCSGIFVNQSNFLTFFPRPPRPTRSASLLRSPSAKIRREALGSDDNRILGRKLGIRLDSLRS